MAVVGVLLTVNGSHKRWTNGYDGIDDLTLRRLLVEINFASRSIEFDLSAREIERNSPEKPTSSTSEGTLAKPPGLRSQKAKETTIRRGDELKKICLKIQNTAHQIEKNGLSGFAVVPGSEKAQLLITSLHDIENSVIPGHDNWYSNTYSAMLWIVLTRAGPAHMLLILHSISPRQFRKLGVHVAAKIVQHVVQNRSKLFCAPLENQFRELSSGKANNCCLR